MFRENRNNLCRTSRSHFILFFQGWIGQALLAESAAYDDEAIDLFRHCTFLGNGLESAIGYGHWICKTLQEMEAEDSAAAAAATAAAVATEEMKPDTRCVINYLVKIT